MKKRDVSLQNQMALSFANDAPQVSNKFGRSSNSSALQSVTETVGCNEASDLARGRQENMHFVDTNVIPDRNAGIGSLLRDLQNPGVQNFEEPRWLAHEFAFIDVGISRAKAAVSLKTLLVNALKMNVAYRATERAETIPYADVAVLGEQAERVRKYLSQMNASRAISRDVKEWHYVVERTGKVSSIAYSYSLYGNEVWESYFLDGKFLYAGEIVEFSDPKLNEILAIDLSGIQSGIELEMRADGDSSQPRPSWEGYRIQKNPLQIRLAEVGISLQRTSCPSRVPGKQNVLFLGNILNHYPHTVRVHELRQIAANMFDGDLVIIQRDGVIQPTVEVLRVVRIEGQKELERIRLIDTKKLELYKPFPIRESWQRIRIRPAVDRCILRLMDSLARQVNFRMWSLDGRNRLFAQQVIGHVFLTFFRSLPVIETLQAAIQEALRRLPLEAGLKRLAVFQGDSKDVYGDALETETNPLVTNADLLFMTMVEPNAKPSLVDEAEMRCLFGTWSSPAG